MLKSLFFTSLLSVAFIQNTYSVQTLTEDLDTEALAKGDKASNVCFVRSFHGGQRKSFTDGSGSLIRPNIVITAAHLFIGQEEDLSDDKASKKKYNQFVKQLNQGKPKKLSGFVTFASDANQVIKEYELSSNPKPLSHFYEIDSVIIDPSFKVGVESHDIAFIKLKTPVNDIEPLSLYEKGTIPLSKLRLHRQDQPNMEMLLDAYAYGYGTDIHQESGRKRGAYQPCFLGIDVTDYNESPDKIEADRKSSITMEPAIPLTAYYPSSKEESRETVITLDETTHKFLDSLNEFLLKKRNGPLGILYKGDSGGPLVTLDKVIGIQSSGDKANVLQGRVKDFSDMPTVLRFCETHFSPLFDIHTGELLPLIPKLIETISAFPLFKESYLGELILAEKNFYDSYIPKVENTLLASNSLIHDINELLKVDLSIKKPTIKKVIEIERKYGKFGEFLFDFESAKKLLKLGRIDDFRNLAKETLLRMKDRDIRLQDFITKYETRYLKMNMEKTSSPQPGQLNDGKDEK